MNPVTVRFWTYINGDYVKLSLKDGEELRWSQGGPTDEGYSWEAERWYRDENMLFNDWCSGGTDCDGPLQRGAKYVSSIHDMKLRSIVPWDGEVEPIALENRGWFPEWDEEDKWQRDVYAERMGY